MIWAALMAARSFAAKIPWPVYALAGALLLAWAWGNHRYSQGVHHERAAWEARVAAEKARGDKATVTAGEQRASDSIRNHDLEKARTDAISANPDDPRLGLNCARLRAAGIDAPPACAGR